MTLRRGDYRDPLEWLLSKERETCAGCLSAITIIAFGEKRKVCKWKSKKYGRRCKFYVDSDAKQV